MGLLRRAQHRAFESPEVCAGGLDFNELVDAELTTPSARYDPPEMDELRPTDELTPEELERVIRDPDTTKVNVAHALAERARTAGRDALGDRLDAIPPDDALNKNLRWKAPKILGDEWPTGDQWDELAATEGDDGLRAALKQMSE